MPLTGSIRLNERRGFGPEVILKRLRRSARCRVLTVMREHLAGRDSGDFIGPNTEGLQPCRAKGRADRHIAGIAPARNDDAADSSRVIAWIENMPRAA